MRYMIEHDKLNQLDRIYPEERKNLAQWLTKYKRDKHHGLGDPYTESAALLMEK